VLAMELTEPHEQRLIEAERARLTDTVGIVVDECFAIRDHRVVDRVPRALELARELVHAAAVFTDLTSHPTAGSVGHRGAGRRDPSLFTGPRSDRTRVIRAFPTMLAPHQPDRPTERSEINQLDLRPILDQRRFGALRARRSRSTRFDHDPQRFLLVDHAEHVHVGQTYQQLADTRRVNFHRGSPGSEGVKHLQIRRAPVPRYGPTQPRSNAKRRIEYP